MPDNQNFTASVRLDCADDNPTKADILRQCEVLQIDLDSFVTRATLLYFEQVEDDLERAVKGGIIK